MAPHDSAFINMENWIFCAPELFYAEKKVNIGMFAESLLYYDHLILDISRPEDIIELIRWAAPRGNLAMIKDLTCENVLEFHHKAFDALPFQHDKNSYSLWNVNYNDVSTISHLQGIVERPEVLSLFPDRRNFEEFFRIIVDNMREGRIDDHSIAIAEANHDFGSKEKNDHAMKMLIDYLFKAKSAGNPPSIECSISNTGMQKAINIVWSQDVRKASAKLGRKLSVYPHVTASAFLHSNSLLRSASIYGCDLVSSSPMDELINRKMNEIANCRLQRTIGKIKVEVEFPDIRDLVNAGSIGLDQILRIRKKATAFRKWMQEGTEKDFDAIRAYHQELGGEIPSKFKKHAINITKMVAASGLGYCVGGFTGAIAGQLSRYVLDLLLKVDEGWTPATFGKWYGREIQRLVR